jgi:hypothetical protein
MAPVVDMQDSCPTQDQVEVAAEVLLEPEDQ